MGAVYEVAGGDFYYKEYIEPQRHAVRLRRLIEWRDHLPQNCREVLDARSAWPLKAVTVNGDLRGFLMNPAPEVFWADMRGERHTLELQHLIHVKTARPLGITLPSRAQRLDLLADLARLLDLMHQHCIVYGDISEKNILWTVRETPQVYVIDCDNARPVDLVDRSGVAMPRNAGWSEPSRNGGGPPDVNSDRYGLAVFCYRVFYGATWMISSGHDYVLPSDAPRIPELEELLSAGLGDPRFRPSAAQWLSAATRVDRSALKTTAHDAVSPSPPGAE